MTELEKLQYTKSFIDKLANGINPLTGEAIPEDELLNNIRVSRCMFYVSGILNELCMELSSGHSKGKSKQTPKGNFHISDEGIQAFEYSESGMYVGDIAAKLNGMVEAENTKKISYNDITKWLIQQQYLYLHTMDDGTKCKRPTQAGLNLGISEELRSSKRGEYYVLLYNVNAQKFIVTNCNTIVEAANNSENQALNGRQWTLEQDKRLTEMFNDGSPVAEMAKECQRTTGAIRARLVHLGLISRRDEAL